MARNYNIFISNKRKIPPIANCWPCSDMLFLRSSYGVPLDLLWIFYGTFQLSQMSNESLHTLPWRENVVAKKPTLKWISRAFEEGSKEFNKKKS